MNDSLHDYHEGLIRHPEVLSALKLEKSEECSLILEDADLIYLIILNQSEEKWETTPFICGNQKIVEHRIHQWHLEQVSKQALDIRLYCLLQHGEIIFDRHDYLKRNRERLVRLSEQTKKKRICEEYSVFLRYYLEAKEFLQHNYALDAYHAVLHALNGWARLVVSEAGEQPEPFLWNQVKRLEPTVYKLFEELIASPEPLEKRIELLLLPIEFHIMSKMKESTSLIVDIVKSRVKPWTFEELRQHPEIRNTQIDLALLLDKMMRRSFIQSAPVKREGKPLLEQVFFVQE